MIEHTEIWYPCLVFPTLPEEEPGPAPILFPFHWERDAAHRRARQLAREMANDKRLVTERGLPGGLPDGWDIWHEDQRKDEGLTQWSIRLYSLRLDGGGGYHPDRLFGGAEAAAFLGLRQDEVEALIRTGSLPAHPTTDPPYPVVRWADIRACRKAMEKRESL